MPIFSLATQPLDAQTLRTHNGITSPAAKVELQLRDTRQRGRNPQNPGLPLRNLHVLESG